MKLHFLGANRQVTGSRYCLEAAGSQILVDCGMFQERPFLERNWATCPIPPADLDAMLLTHVHIDHSGLIPRIVGEGFRGPIHCTRPSAELAPVMLLDSARIQTEDAEYKRKRHQREARRGKFPEVALYTEAEVNKALPLFRPTAYKLPVEVAPGVSVTFHDAGHILGSAMLEVAVIENGEPRKVLFSGDIGQWNKPLIRDPSLFDAADYVIMESTYGDRNHEDGGDIETQFATIINETVSAGGNLVIPTFAVERAQELMYYIGRLVHAGRIPSLRVFLDSPMAVDVTEIYLRFHDCFDEETWRMISSGEPPLHFPGLKLVSTVADSKDINKVKEPCIIMSSSGMCNAGRIKHHLRQNIGRRESTILFVGYQGEGTLGRQILSGQEDVRIHGELRRVKARIAQIYGFSGHADRSALLRWIGALKAPPKRVFLTHGEEAVAVALAETLRQQFGFSVRVPEYGEVAELE
jgi:metallo-beta-lactamase family protein